MGGKAGLVKRRYGLELKPAINENARVAGEGLPIA